MRTGLIVAGLLHLAGVVSLPGQQRAAPFLRWELSAPSPGPITSPQTAKDESESLGDYRYEGLAFGGLVFGAFGVYAGLTGFRSVSVRAGGALPLHPDRKCYRRGPGGGCPGRGTRVSGGPVHGQEASTNRHGSTVCRPGRQCPTAYGNRPATSTGGAPGLVLRSAAQWGR